MGGLSEVWGEINQAAGAAERLSELLEVQSKIKSPEHPAPLPEPPRGEIGFDDVVFAYPTRPAVSALNGISFEAKRGERLAIVGPSGAGKTTIFALLLRFYDPQAGTVTVDGVAVKDADLKALRSRFAIVPRSRRCSPTPSPAISPMAPARRAPPRSRRRRGRPSPMISSWRCRKATTPWSAKAA